MLAVTAEPKSGHTKTKPVISYDTMLPDRTSKQEMMKGLRPFMNFHRITCQIRLN